MSEKTPRYDTKTKSYYTLGGLGGKEYKTTVRDNTTGKTHTGYSSRDAQTSRDNAFKKANYEE
jgi:hypothetical protein